MRGQDLDAGTREVLRGEATVVADHHAAVRGPLGGEVLGHARAQRRTLWKVKSSAMAARQPSVPNLIFVTWRLSYGARVRAIRRSARTLDLVEGRLQLGEARPERASRGRGDLRPLVDSHPAEGERHEVLVPPAVQAKCRPNGHRPGLDRHSGLARHDQHAAGDDGWRASRRSHQAEAVAADAGHLLGQLRLGPVRLSGSATTPEPIDSSMVFITIPRKPRVLKLITASRSAA